MYEKFFSFKEKPFKLVPNPAYLFLGKSHEETLAHLNFALSEGVGFVEITGEVGTGKTTLCRAFLDSLDSDTIPAYIFNPRLGPRQLIRAINDELGVKYDANNTKDLIDKLNSFLLGAKAQRKKVILLIDEAQNLSRNVLEQLRLLSNLETNREKLLQVILVGQPELSEILDSHELRQLSQRITLRYQLSPLDYEETVAYIRYRISIAAQDTGIKFNHSAFRQIYKYSKGIPRVINIACDRSLLTAFGLNRYKITGGIARASIKELAGTRAVGKNGLRRWIKLFVFLAVLSIVVTALIYHRSLLNEINQIFKLRQSSQLNVSAMNGPGSKKSENDSQNSRDVYNSDESMAPVSGPQIQAGTPVIKLEASTTDDTGSLVQNLPSNRQDPPTNKVAPGAKEILRLGDYLAAMDIRSSRHAALESAMGLWQTPVELKPYLDSLDDDHAFFRLTVKPSGIFIHRMETNLNLLKRLDLPVILEFYPADSEEPGYLTLSQADEDRISFDLPKEDKLIMTTEDEINHYWSGVAYLPWKNYLSITGTLPTRTNSDSIITLKMLLNELGYNNVEINDDYDNQTRNVIEEIQTKYGIIADGFVGPLTKIILYKTKGSFDMPRLSKGT
jgi:general secretion pathway protein A